MDINELETYRLADAVKFHDRLNPGIWSSENELLPRVRERLLAVAEDFRQYLGVDDLEIQDITISGSNAAYTYTPHSDIDLHLVVDLPEADRNEVYRELFDAKKYAYNDQHDIRIGGHEVELYVQNANEPHYSQGIYSVRDNQWIQVPNRRQPRIDDISVQSKYQDMGARIEQAIASGDVKRMQAVAQRVRDMRQSGLARTGEFGPENLAFKILRNNGTLDQLRQARLQAQDRRFSLDERRRRKGRKRSSKKSGFQWGVYGGWFYPGFNDNSGADGGGDGGGGESVQESQESPDDIIQRFAASCAEYLSLENPPQIRLRRDPEWTRRNGTFGRYTAGDPDRIELATSGRHIIDILRTLAHEMVHAQQNQLVGLPINAGETGSEFENDANARAGEIMRHWAEREPQLFQGVELEEGWRERAAGLAAAACVAGTPGCATTGTTTAADALRTVQTVGRVAQNLPTRAGAEEELRQELQNLLRRQRGQPEVPGRVVREASGYIPTEAEKDDPRFSMALTQDIRPGETGRQANKLGLKTDSQGRPDLLMKKLGNLLESMKLDEGKKKGSHGRACWKGYRRQGRDDCVRVGEDQTLQEVKISPGRLEKWSRSPEAQKTRLGFEFEMIFPDTYRDEDGLGQSDSEPIELEDRRPTSIDDIIEFFGSGEQGLSVRGAREMREALTARWEEWKDQEFYDERFDEEKYMEWVDQEIWPRQESEYIDRAAKELDLDRDDDRVQPRARELFDEEAQRQWDEEDQWRTEAEQALRDEWEEMADEDSWLDNDSVVRRMSDVADYTGIDFPWFYAPAEDSENLRTWESWRDEISQLVGMPVRIGTGDEDTWGMVPDVSLNPRRSQDAGIEVTSPPLPLPEALDRARRIMSWAQRNGIETGPNLKTGLHTNISTPAAEVDYVKLVLFMGDQYVLDEFERAANHYTQSALKKLAQTAERAREREGIDEDDQRDPGIYRGRADIGQALEAMRSNMIELAQRYVQQGVGSDKYTSAHVKPREDGGSYIEFRGPGGDYLGKGFDTVRDTALRLAWAMNLAADPQAERREYAKKLYNLLMGTEVEFEPQDPVSGRTRQQVQQREPLQRLFAQYSRDMAQATTASQRQEITDRTKREWARAVLDQSPAETYGFQGQYEVYDQDSGQRGERDSYTVIDTFQANSDQEAMEKAHEKWIGQGVRFGVRRKIETGPQDRRTDTARRIQSTVPIWHISNTELGTSVLVASRTEVGARLQARRENPAWDPKDISARRATEAEIQTYRQQPRGTAPAVPTPTDTSERTYRVSWTEQRPGRGEIQDQLDVAAADAEDAMARVQQVLDLQGRQALNIDAQETTTPAWRQAQNQMLRNVDQTYRVTWRVRTPSYGSEEDSTRISARNSQQAQDIVRRDLEAQGREIIDMHSELVPASQATTDTAPAVTTRPAVTLGRPQINFTRDPAANWAIVRRNNGEIVIPFQRSSQAEAEQYFQDWTKSRIGSANAYELVPLTPPSQQQTAGEWTGHWIIQRPNGRELARFHGIGNSQADANRYAQRWLEQNGYGSGTEVEVVPEMR